MKKVFNFFYSVFPLAFFVTIFISSATPAQVFAESSMATSQEANTSLIANSSASFVVNDFCTKLPALAGSINSEVDNRAKQIANKQSFAGLEFYKSSGARQQQISKDRAIWDNNRDQQYSSLYKRAKNDEQRIAVDTFKTTVDDAIKLRRTRVDQSMELFEKTVGDYLYEENNNLSVATKTYQGALITATTKAISNCTNKNSQNTSRSDLVTSLEKAQSELKTGSSGYITVEDKMIELSKQRREAVDLATAQFENKLAQAKSDLAQAFKE